MVGSLVAGDPDKGCRIAIEIKTSGMLHHHFLGLWGRGRVVASSGEQAAVRPIIDFGRWWTAPDDLNCAPAEHPAVTGGFVRGDGGTIRTVPYGTYGTVIRIYTRQEVSRSFGQEGPPSDSIGTHYYRVDISVLLIVIVQ